MGFKKGFLIQINSIFALFLISTSNVFAGTGITFGPVSPSAIPTLSTTMLIVLSVLLMVVAFRVAKNRESGSSKFMVAFIGSAILMTSGGVKLVSDLNANVTTARVTSSAGQTLGISAGAYNQYENITTVPMEVLSISTPANCAAFNAGIRDTDQLCRVGLVLVASDGTSDNAVALGSCEIDCRDLDPQ